MLLDNPNYSPNSANATGQGPSVQYSSLGPLDVPPPQQGSSIYEVIEQPTERGGEDPTVLAVDGDRQEVSTELRAITTPTTQEYSRLQYQ